MTEKKIKLVCFYLPQYYTFKENDEWWGEGFTEWVNVKKAKKLFPWHNQPQLPYNNFFYELNHNHHETMSKQIKLAKRYGIYGFCFYHYWFKGGKKLLEVPVEKFLSDKSLDINFCLSWANEPWTRAWDGGNKQVIMPQEYGEEVEWKAHFYYLLPFFRDRRYMRRNGKPIFIVYRPELIEKLDQMLDLWLSLARSEGLEGIDFISQGHYYGTTRNKNERIQESIMFEPNYTQESFSLRRFNPIKLFLSDPRFFMNLTCQKIKLLIGRTLRLKGAWWNNHILNYDLVWGNILNRKDVSKRTIPGAFTGWDNSPRRGDHGSRIIRGSTPEKFKKNLKALIIKTALETDEDMIFINAWNEWAEGAHLEPDQKNGYKYLEAVRDALNR